MKNILEKILYYLSRLILWRQHPDVVGITGSVGKTSAKEAVYTVLASRYKVRRNIRNYNNEIGVPLTIIGSDTGGRNPIRWLWIINKALLYGLLPLSYPDILVLEMGADHPGDIKYLTKLAPARIGIVTAIGEQPSHIEFFRDVDHLAKEKLIMCKHVSKEGWVIINLDDSRIREAATNFKSQIVSIGIDHEADLRAVEIQYSHNPREIVQSSHIAGLRFKLEYKGSIVPFFIPRVVGIPQVYATLIAAAVGITYDMNLVEVSEAMKQYESPRGRMNLVAGKQQSLIIDDSYNSSPAAVYEALEVFNKIESPSQRIICLGNLEELGSQSKRAHTLIGKAISQIEVDYLITVGDKGKWISEAAIANGLPAAAVAHCEDVSEAIQYAGSRVKPFSVILVKGSQSARLEKVVKSLMAEPQRAKELLVRQYGHWTKV